MKFLKSVSLVAIAAFILSSCAAVYVTEYTKAPGFNINNERSKTSTVTGFEPVIIKEFVKTFGKRYVHTQDFATEYTKKFQRKISVDKMFASIVYDSAVEWKSTRPGSFAKSELDAIDSLFNSCKSDYIITISDFEVANRIVTTTTGGYGPGNMGTTSSTEYCVIKARFIIYDVKTRKKMQEFISLGEQSVFLFGFDTAFTKAVDSSIDHAIAYLKTGKKEF